MITNNTETIDNTETIEEMKMIYDWSENTTYHYKIILNLYTTFHQQTITELIEEAENDELNINRVNKRRIKKRLLQFHLHLKKQNKTPNTIKDYLAKIQKVYKHYDIETPTIPKIRNNIIETYEDIPTQQEITKAILHSRTKMKAIITLLASSGLRVSDACNLTINDFFTATKDYHKAHTLLDMIKQLEAQELIIPEFHIKSIKTNISHITFCSHEASIYILQMLNERLLKKEVSLEDSLFEVISRSMTQNFNRVNEKNRFGWKQTRRKFHAHALRKYFATTLTTNGMDYLSTEFLLGHTLSSVQASYYYANPERLKQKYVNVLDYITFTMKIEHHDINSREKQELEELREFKRLSDERLKKLEKMVNNFD